MAQTRSGGPILMRLLRRVAFGASLLVLAACANMQAGPAAKPTIGTWGFDTATMDPAVRPGDDFFQYVNGTWIKTTVMPADKARYGSFDALRDKSEADVRATIEENAKLTHAPGSAGQKVGDFYNAFIDTAMIETLGLAPAKPDLDAIAGARTHNEIAVLMAQPGIPGGPVGLGVGLNSRKSRRLHDRHFTVRPRPA